MYYDFISGEHKLAEVFTAVLPLFSFRSRRPCFCGCYLVSFATALCSLKRGRMRCSNRLPLRRMPSSLSATWRSPPDSDLNTPRRRSLKGIPVLGDFWCVHVAVGQMVRNAVICEIEWLQVSRFLECCTYIHTLKNTYIHTYIHTYTHTYIHPYMHFLCTHEHAYIRAYVHTYIRTYTHIHTYTHPGRHTDRHAYGSRCPVCKHRSVYA